MRFENPKGSAGIIMITALAFIVGGAIMLYSYANGLRSESVRQETALNAQYLANQNYLSAYITGFYEQLGVADRKSEKLDDILSEAVKGRYDDGGFSANGAFFSAVVEAYPVLGDLNVYDKIVDYVAAQREGYRAVQDKLLDMLRRYDSWRQDGIIQSRVIASALGIPSERLKARIGDEVTTGQVALNQMYRIVLASQAREAYTTGVMEPLAPPSSK